MREQCNHNRHCAKSHDATDGMKNKVIKENLLSEECLEIISRTNKTANTIHMKMPLNCQLSYPMKIAKRL